MLQENGYGDFWWPLTGLLGFFTCDIAALILLFYIMGDAIAHDVEKKSEMYAKLELTRCEDLMPDRVKEKLLSQKFKATKDGYLKKKVFSFAKDSICYYVRSVTSSDVKGTIDEEFKRISNLSERAANLCLLLFIYKSNPDEEDFAEVKQTSTSLMIGETVIPRRHAGTSIIILVDEMTNEGYFLDMNSKMNLAIYAYGCRLIKKYFLKGRP